MTTEDSQNKKNKQGNDSSETNEQQSLKQKAIKYKAFQHTFSPRDLKKGISEKKILRRLRESKHLEETYYKYIKELEKNPTKKIVFPWENPFSRMVFLISFWMPRVFKLTAIILLFLFVINTLPGPTQHIVEFFIARTLYDTAPVQRVPENLATYAHSAKIVDTGGGIIKSYGKRKVTQEIPFKVKMALLACEDHYLLPHEKNPWHVNTFLIHAGVSWPNLAGAVKDTLSGHPRGASTIIMQNAKKILGNSDRTIANKLEEIIVAYMMVAKFGKDKNLDFYINTVPVGSNMYGFSAAAQNYFKMELEDLNLQQLVAISSFIPNHNRQLAFYQLLKGKSFDELDKKQLRHAREAINKINLALDYLTKLEEITPEQRDQWRITDEESIRRIGFRDYHSPLYGEEEWTSWNVIREVCSKNYSIDGKTFSGAELMLDVRGDVVVETAVNLDLVQKNKEAISAFLNSPGYHKILKKRNKKLWEKDLKRFQKRNITPPYTDFEGFMDNLYQNVNAGIIIINQQGEILSYVGGKEFIRGGNERQENESNPIIIDLMNKQAKLTPASTIKPLIAYFAMTSNNSSLQTLFEDKPIEYKYSESAGKKIWLPRNWYPYDREGKGKNRYLGRKYSLLEAQVLSVNTIFARLYSNSRVRNSLLLALDRIGVNYNRDDARFWPFGIGASDVDVQKWLGIYNAFLDGDYREPSFVKRILVDNKIIFERDRDLDQKPIALFDSKKIRQDEMQALYQVCNRGTGASMKSEFKYHKNLVSGKTGTAPGGKATLFISHFNPYQDRQAHSDKTMTMIVLVTTNSGGMNSVGTSGQGPVKIAGKIYNHLFQTELQAMMDKEIESAKRNNPHFRNNHVYWANVDRYMKRLLEEKSGKHYIHESVIGVDAYQEALQQILNSRNQIYTGKDDLFEELVRYYASQEKIVKMN
ncbi:MAG: transglycosylase domain-containing protein [Desulfobulbaceae bacterium]|nr:transglycosylase domain-containing protein [Desulfobulbaceae bacterium]